MRVTLQSETLFIIISILSKFCMEVSDSFVEKNRHSQDSACKNAKTTVSYKAGGEGMLLKRKVDLNPLWSFCIIYTKGRECHVSQSKQRHH